MAFGAPTVVVLAVEDDPGSLQLLRYLVNHAGYECVEASTPLEAIGVLETDPRIGMVLTDVRMPGSKDGLHLIHELAERWPSLPVAAVTGYPEDLEVLSSAVSTPIVTVFPKPIGEQDMVRLIRLIKALGRTNVGVVTE
jgi:DNA-binding NtrC family response regulator